MHLFKDRTPSLEEPPRGQWPKEGVCDSCLCVHCYLANHDAFDRVFPWYAYNMSEFSQTALSRKFVSRNLIQKIANENNHGNRNVIVIIDRQKRFVSSLTKAVFFNLQLLVLVCTNLMGGDYYLGRMEN